MGFKNIVKRLFIKETPVDDAGLFLALNEFLLKIQRAKRKDGQPGLDLRSFATSSEKVYITGDNRNKAVTYLNTLTREELWNKYNEVYLLQELSKNAYHDYVFPDADHSYIMYYISPSDFMRLVQKEMGRRKFSRN